MSTSRRATPPPARPEHPISDRDAAALVRLATYRLERSLTFDGLAAEMKAAGYPVPGRALHLALTHRLRTHPRETTLYKITQFVEHIATRPAALPRGRRTA